VPGTGTPATQVHDNNGGIPASGLFWTVPAHERDLQISRDGRRAVLDLRDVAVIDSFQFFSPNQVPATVTLHVEWRAIGPFTSRGSGAGVPGTDMRAFRGDIAPARSVGSFSGAEWGFAFTSDPATTDRGYAQMGRTRNGTFLSPGF
jgi:hypothetical protein